MKNFKGKYVAWATKKAGVDMTEIDTCEPMDMRVRCESDDEDDDDVDDAN